MKISEEIEFPAVLRKRYEKSVQLNQRSVQNNETESKIEIIATKIYAYSSSMYRDIQTVRLNMYYSVILLIFCIECIN